MNIDIEQTLDGADEDMRAFVASLRAAPQARVRDGFTADVLASVRAVRMRGAFVWKSRAAMALSLAACLAICLVLGVLFVRQEGTSCPAAGLAACQRADGTFSGSSASAYVQAFAVTALAKGPMVRTTTLGSAVDALVRSQNAAGGWENDEVSARNVLALRTAVDAGVGGARAAYKRGLRYLHARGISELTMQDLVREAHVVQARLGVRGDVGLTRCAALCAAL